MTMRIPAERIQPALAFIQHVRNVVVCLSVIVLMIALNQADPAHRTLSALIGALHTGLHALVPQLIR